MISRFEAANAPEPYDRPTKGGETLAMRSTWMPLVVLMHVVGCSGSSQTSDRDRCMAFAPEVMIGGCTAVIQSGQETWEHLASAFFNRGFAYYGEHQYDRAIQDFDQATRLQPKAATGSGQAVSLAVIFNYRGNAYRNKSQYDRAIEDLDQAIRLNPNAAETFVDRGVAYRGGGQYDRAVQDFDQAIRLAANFALAFYNRGIVLRAQGHQDRAATDFAQAKQLNPTLPPPP